MRQRAGVFLWAVYYVASNEMNPCYMLGNIVLVVLLVLTVVSWSNDPSAERKKRSEKGMVVVFFTLLAILLYRVL